MLDPADSLWTDCVAAATEILGEPGYCGSPDGSGYPKEWKSRSQGLRFPIDTRWVAIWPSTGEPAPAIGLIMQGGFLERSYEGEAAQLDLRIWRPATPRVI
ncbi:hypothetical protein ACFZAE_08370 [Streptomyces scabiei]|uniref:hypothetical protein n=1 Tax=Streptomyces scabiei TaxID=1930 RepID=UPI0036E4FA5D